MKDNDVASIAKQFNLDKEIVEASVEDGTLSQRIADSMKNKKIYTDEEFNSFKANFQSEVINTYFNDLVEKAKKSDLPQDLYKPIKGAAYQQLERELSELYGINDYQDLKDLVDKAVKSSANISGGDEELQRQVDALKKVNLALKEEKENAVSEVEKKYKTDALTREQKALLDSIPFDFSGFKSDELDAAKERQQTLLKGVFEQNYSLDYINGQVVVKKGDEIVKNEATLDPIPASNVFVNLAKEYNLKLKSPDTGGQGGTSSRNSTGQYASVDDFYADMKSKGIEQSDPKFVEAWKDSGLSNNK